MEIFNGYCNLWQYSAPLGEERDKGVPVCHPLAVCGKALIRQQFLHLEDLAKDRKVGVVASSNNKKLAIFCLVGLKRFYSK